jgi:hypothetical protein
MLGYPRLPLASPCPADAGAGTLWIPVVLRGLPPTDSHAVYGTLIYVTVNLQLVYEKGSYINCRVLYLIASFAAMLFVLVGKTGTHLESIHITFALR